MNVEKLLAPIAPDRPAGESLRYEGTYDRIHEARLEDDVQLEQGPWKKKVAKRADWAAVEALCATALETRTKDVQIAVWLLEAWVQLHGYAGMREGLTLVRELCERFWDSLHPEIDDDGVEARVSPIHWLNEKFPARISHLLVAQAESGATYTLGDLESARLLTDRAARDKSLMEAAEAEGVVTEAMIDTAASATPSAFYHTVLADVRGSFLAAVALEQLLDARCGAAAPSLRGVRERLAMVDELAGRALAARGEEAPADEPPPPAPDAPREPAPETAPTPPALRAHDAPAAAPALKTMPADARIMSRADAYRMLEAAAMYLMRIEPHSPTPYMVMRAVSWGSKSLTELLPELLRDERLLAEIATYLGLPERRE
jgi:type VI secretion system ImpA family protein